MAAIGLSTNLKDLNKMGYKPFIVGFISLLTVGFVSLVAINNFSENHCQFNLLIVNNRPFQMEILKQLIFYI